MLKYLTVSEVIEIMKRDASELGSQAALAHKAGVSPAYISDIILGHRYPSQKILKHYGFRKVVMFEVQTPSAPAARTGE